MKSSFTYIQRLGLLTLLLGLLFVCLLRMGGQSWASWQQYQQIRPQLDQLARAPQLMRQQQQQIEAAKVVFQRQQAQVQVDSHLDFVSYLNKQSQALQLNVVSLPTVSYDKQASYHLASEVFSVEGGYQQILQLLYAMEYADRLGRIDHVHVERQRHLIGGKRHTYLVAHCTLIRFEAQPS